MSETGAALRRVYFLADNTVREAARQKLFGWLGLVASAVVVGAQTLRDFNFGAPELKFIADCGLAAMAFFGAALVITATTQLLFGEFESRTALTLLAKPMRRSEFLFGKLLGVVVLAAVFCAVVGACLVAVLWFRERGLAQTTGRGSGGGIAYGVLAIAVFLQWLELCVLAALTLLISSYARSQLFAVAAAFFVFVICQVQHLAHDAYALAESAWMRAVAGMMSWLLPNFQVFSLADSLDADAVAAGHVVRVAVYAAIYVGAAAGVAVISFRRREI